MLKTNTQKLFFISFLMLISLVSFCYADTYNDSFTYGTTFVSNGWQYISANGAYPQAPVKYAGIKGFGFNFTSSPPASSSIDIRKNIASTENPFACTYGVSCLSKYMSVRFSFYDGNDTVIQGTHGEIDLKVNNASGSSGTPISILLSYLPASSGLANSTLISFNGATGSQNCSFAYSRYTWHDIYIYFNFAGMKYDAYMDGFTQCTSFTMSGTFNISAIDINSFSDAGDNQQFLINNLKLNNSADVIPVPESHGSHVLFWDDFNYANSLYSQKGWFVYEHGMSINTVLSPINNKLTLIDSAYYAPSHQTGSYPYTFKIGHSQYITSTIFSPVFCSQFTVNVSSSLNDSIGSCMQYTAYNSASAFAYDVALCSNGSMYYIDDSLNQYGLCDGCYAKNTISNMKICTFFSQKKGFPFNSSITQDKVTVTLDNSEYKFLPAYWSDRITNLGGYNFLKTEDARFTIDDYYVYVGTDKDINNINQYYTALYGEDNITVTNIDITKGDALPSDFAETIKAFYWGIGLRSIASRFIAGLFLTLVAVILIVVLSAMSGTQIPAFAYMIVAMLVSAICMYIELYPSWLGVLMIILGLGGLIFSLRTNNAQ